jgi:hypothetical protein
MLQYLNKWRKCILTIYGYCIWYLGFTCFLPRAWPTHVSCSFMMRSQGCWWVKKFSFVVSRFLEPVTESLAGTNSVAPEPEGSSPYSQEPTNGPYPELVESSPHPQPISLRSILIPSSHQSLGLSSGLFTFWLSHQSPVHIPLLSHACHMSRLPHSLWFDLPSNIWGGIQTMKLLTVQLPPFSCYFILLRSKYSP